MELWISAHTCLHIVWFLCGATWFQQCPNAGICLFRWGQTHRNNVVPVWFHVVPTLTAGLLLDGGSALAKGGQVMFRPQPLHQLPKLPSHVLSEGASCLAPPPFNILGRRESYLSLVRLPFTVCSSLPRPGLSLVQYVSGCFVTRAGAQK